MSLVLTTILAYRCNYAERMKNFKNTGKRIGLVNKISSKWRPIRITLNYDIIEGKEYDPMSCKRVGQQINDPYEGNIICEEQDIINKKQILAIKGTINNVVRFLTNAIKVQSLLEPIITEYNNVTRIYNDTDFVINVSYKFSHTFAAAATVDQIDEIYSRPIIGMIYFNPRETPNEVVNENDWNNGLFYTVLHEITHALGFSSNLYEFYHPHENPETYKNITCQISKYGITYTFLITPHAHIFAKKRFGVETFIGDNGTSCPSGIELEDGGSVGTAGSHLEYRTFNTEYMVGSVIEYPVPFSRFTDATMAILLDTGNYKVIGQI